MLLLVLISFRKEKKWFAFATSKKFQEVWYQIAARTVRSLRTNRIKRREGHTSVINTDRMGDEEGAGVGDGDGDGNNGGGGGGRFLRMDQHQHQHPSSGDVININDGGGKEEEEEEMELASMRKKRLVFGASMATLAVVLLVVAGIALASFKGNDDDSTSSGKTVSLWNVENRRSRIDGSHDEETGTNNKMVYFAVLEDYDKNLDLNEVRLDFALLQVRASSVCLMGMNFSARMRGLVVTT